jgi:hypothetical protein
MFEKFFSKKESKETKKEISKIHFLIHPGYILESEFAKNNYFGMETLLEDYIKKAKKLKNNELMVIFAPSFKSDFIKDFKNKAENENTPKKYVDTIRKIVEILSDPTLNGVMGNRAIVLADTDLYDVYENKGARFLENREKIWDKLKNIIEKRGFVFSEKVEAEAYGEYKSICVRDIARNMRFAANSPITSQVAIKDELTEERHRYPEWVIRKNFEK